MTQDTPHVFGAFDNLMGVVTLPVVQRSDTALIMLTPGMLHHVGPFRLHVQMARALAGAGMLSLRFDLSGIGESLPIGAAGSSLQRAANEVGQAMDLITADYGLSKFILFGLCSGADDSLYASLGDDRVVGSVLLDGCGYPTPAFRWVRMYKHYLPRLCHPGKWWQIALRFAKGNAHEPASLRLGDDIREFPDREQAAREVQQLVDRGVRMHFIYTGGVGEYFNHYGQFRDMFHDVDFRGQVSCRYFPDMDHVAILSEDRIRLIEDVVQWAHHNFCRQESGQLAPDQHEPATVSS